MDLFGGNSQGPTRHLDHFGVQALAHLGSPVSDENCAVCVDVHQSSSLRQTERKKTDLFGILTNLNEAAGRRSFENIKLRTEGDSSALITF